MKRKQLPADERRKLRGTHVMVFAGDGRDQPAELLFSSGAADESNQVHDLVEKLMADRMGGLSVHARAADPGA